MCRDIYPPNPPIRERVRLVYGGLGDRKNAIMSPFDTPFLSCLSFTQPSHSVRRQPSLAGTVILSEVAHLQNLPQLRLLLCRQCRRELDIVLNNEVAALTGLLGDRHAESRVRLSATRLCRPGLVDVQVLAVDRSHSALPACQRLFQI